MKEGKTISRNFKFCGVVGALGYATQAEDLAFAAGPTIGA
jgi:hypothetical protein